jgi:hypothetical protein
MPRIEENQPVNADRPSETSVLDIEITRDTDKGLLIKLKSNQDLSIFKNRGSSGSVKIGKVECHRPAISHLDDVNSIFTEEDTWASGANPNLTMLLAKGLKDGVTFNFGLFPVSEEMLRSWVENLKTQMKVIYLTYCKPVQKKVVISARTVEVEEHE